MSFIIGLSFVFYLVLFTIVLVYVSKLLPNEFILLPIALMLFGDGMLVGVHYYGLRGIVENVKEFKIGISMAFMFATFSRAMYLMVISNKK